MILQIFEALYDDHIQLSLQEWKDLVENPLNDGTDTGKLVWCMARTASCLQRRRAALKPENFDRSALFSIKEELSTLALEVDPVLQALRQQYEDCGAVMASKLPATIDKGRFLHSYCCRAYALGLSFALLIQLLLETYSTNDTSGDDSDNVYVAEILRMCEEVAIYKPLGAMSMIACLCIACMGAGNSGQSKMVVDTLVCYRQDIIRSGSPIDAKALEEVKSHMTLNTRIAI